MPTNLSVNLNAVALLRNRRGLAWPSVTGIGGLALEAGAHGLTVHPRPDERHITRADVFALNTMIKTDWLDREFNIEGFPDERFLKIVQDVRPDQATLVPDDPEQATSDHGWAVSAKCDLLGRVIEKIKRLGVRVSLFIDAVPEHAVEAVDVGADRVEIYTGPYGALKPGEAIEPELARISQTVEAALAGGLFVNAGHDLTLENLPALIAKAPQIAECSIGHCFTADCLIYGVEETVKRYLKALGH